MIQCNLLSFGNDMKRVTRAQWLNVLIVEPAKARVEWDN